MNLDFREARETDITDLVKLLADDVLGASREDLKLPLDRRYTDAFYSIEKDGNNELIVVESNGELVGMLQLTFIPYLTHTGSWRCLIEGVRIANTHWGMGLGSKLVSWAIDRAKTRNCSIVQLTSDKQRPEVIRFYESHGFEATHEGFKLKL